MSDKNIYIILSRTNTKFAKVIRAFGNIKYNHASIALDEGLNEIYGFARQRHAVVLTGKLMRENISRFTLNATKYVDSSVFKIPVTEEQYAEIKRRIEVIYNDGDYLYNLFSVLTYPITKGLSVYKAFTCNEFVLYILKYIGIEVDRPLCEYKPDDLLSILNDKLHFQGNLLEYVEEKTATTDYFEGFRASDLKESAVCLSKLLFRTVTLKKNELY